MRIIIAPAKKIVVDTDSFAVETLPQFLEQTDLRRNLTPVPPVQLQRVRLQRKTKRDDSPSPKGTDFKKASQKKLRETTDWINNHPRKMFGFHTAAELFAAAFPGLPSLY